MADPAVANMRLTACDSAPFEIALHLRVARGRSASGMQGLGSGTVWFTKRIDVVLKSTAADQLFKLLDKFGWVCNLGVPEQELDRQVASYLEPEKAKMAIIDPPSNIRCRVASCVWFLHFARIKGKCRGLGRPQLSLASTVVSRVFCSHELVRVVDHGCFKLLLEVSCSTYFSMLSHTQMFSGKKIGFSGQPSFDQQKLRW